MGVDRRIQFRGGVRVLGLQVLTSPVLVPADPGVIGKTDGVHSSIQTRVKSAVRALEVHRLAYGSRCKQAVPQARQRIFGIARDGIGMLTRCIRNHKWNYFNVI
jgi:hypothetical protein